MKPAEYRAIAAWNHHIGGFAYYAEEQQLQAAVDGAPVDALYRVAPGNWVTLRELKTSNPPAHAHICHLLNDESRARQHR